MNHPIIIIGSGFAAYQLVKTLRRKGSDTPIQLFTCDSGDEYNKPDLSHVFSRQKSADDLVSLTGEAFAKAHQIALFANTRVENIDADAHTITANGVRYPYSKLVLATGAKTFVPKLTGNAVEEIVTINSLDEYRSAQQGISRAERIIIMGGGLIGTELAMDLAASGKQVRIIEPASHLMRNMLPDFIAIKLEEQLRSEGIKIDSQNCVTSMMRDGAQLMVNTNKGNGYLADCVLSAAGIVPNTQLAQQAGVKVNRGIVVDKQLATTVNDVFALGDCAEIDGKVMAFLQPIILSANVLADTLLLGSSELTLSAMMVKVKTPNYPIQLAGHYDHNSHWQVTFSPQGVMAKAYDANECMTGFVVTQNKLNYAFPLFRELQRN